LGVRALVLGGARSGKSAFAERLAAEHGESVLYVATAEAGDAGLEERVLEHRRRRPGSWGTLELGGGDLSGVFEAAGGWGSVLLDSLTLWVSARMYGGEDGETTLEDLDRFLRRAGEEGRPLIVVSDEVGLGVVPESAAGRRFRDLLGLANQRVAAASQEVYLCVAGTAIRTK
jgi:adenosylcobinamide kinase/adenosylcobinamide-phosphate guanylyltransferase